MLEQYSFSTTLSLLTLTLLIAVVIASIQRVKPNLQRPIPGVPIATLPGKTPMESWCSTKELLSYAYQKYGEQPFQVISPLGATLIVRNQYAENMKSDKRLSLNEAARREMFEHIPGFEGATMLFKTYPVLPDALRTKLTPSLGLIMEDLVEETRLTLDDMFGRCADGNWKEMPDPLAESILHIVARVSSRIFLGAPLCRDDEWLVIAKTYTKHAFRGSRGLRAISPWLQRIKSNSMPDILACRKAQRDAENLIREEVARRDAAMRAALARGEKAPKRNNDAIAWLTETSQNIGRDLSVRDLCYLQISLSVAAIHMTSELLTHAMLYTCQYPEIVEPLREEVVSVLKTYGWNKKGMYQLRLMDSFLKEVQRCTRTLLSMFRVGREDVVIAGVKVPKGTKIWVEAPIDHEPIYGPDANNFDAWRFVKLASSREKEGKRNDCHFTTASKEHLNWGYGEQTCPGRFFAAQEIKIVLSHLLLHYDWSFNPGVEKPNNISFEVLQAIPNPTIKLRFRKRQPELDMDLVN